MKSCGVHQSSQEPHGVIWIVVCASYSLTQPIAIVVIYYIARWSVYEKIITSKITFIALLTTYNNLVLVLDERAQPDSYIRRIAL